MTTPDPAALAEQGRALITVPMDDVKRLDELVTRHQLKAGFGRAVTALERELTRHEHPYAWGERCIQQLRIILGLDPLTQLLTEPPAERLTEDERHELQEAIWGLGELLASDEERLASGEEPHAGEEAPS